jgi:anaerobic magnesium-protoporphyrin IX monomethyl ester cyclase
MKILFFYIDSHTSSGYSTGLGIASISGFLKKNGVSTELVYYKSRTDLDYGIKKIKKFNPAVIGFYSTSSGFHEVLKISLKLKNHFPDIFQIAGGVHATLNPDILEKMPGLDAFCIGYGEKPLLELLRRIDRKKAVDSIPGIAVRKKNPSEIQNSAAAFFPGADHDDFLFFDHVLFLEELKRYKDFQIQNYPLEIIFNRGCPFHCTFCSNHELNKKLKNKIF